VPHLATVLANRGAPLLAGKQCFPAAIAAARRRDVFQGQGQGQGQGRRHRFCEAAAHGKTG
jgi:hypothetical protein